jgi:pimeloyl-ACP methyl ester carboxylesterase
MKKAIKITAIVLSAILALALLFTLITVIVHGVKTGQEIELLKAGGYYNPVSVGDYSLNVACFGNEKGKHTIVGLAGLGMGDYSVAARRMTAPLEEDNLVVFVDRAGYGFSDDADHEMTLEDVVEDYRAALKNAGIEGPYVLMPHSIGGAYATFWCSKYPEEIEGVVFVDGSQLSADAFAEEPPNRVNALDKLLALLARMGFGRYVLRDYFYHYPDNYTEEEQKLGDALMLMTIDSVSTLYEEERLAENAQRAFCEIVENDVPKLYISSSWGIESKEDIVELALWINRQIEINHIDTPKWRTDYDDESVEEIIENFETARRDMLQPYLDKMGNCNLVCLGGDHMIYEQKPEECARILSDFIDGLDK